MTLPNTFGTIATGAQEPGSALDANFQAIGSSAILQCTASGTNAIALTEMNNVYQPTSYSNYQLFSFIAPNNSTGAATLAFRALAALPWYKAGATPAAETQLGNGDVVQNTLYIVAQVSALNGGNGGFVTVSAIAGSTGTALPTVIVQDRKASSGNGSALTQNAYTDHDLNTLILNTVGGATAVSTPNLTLPPGTYDVTAWAQINPGAAAQWRLRLFNTTAGAVQQDVSSNDVVGLSMSSGAAGIPTPLRARFTIAVQSNMKFQEWVSAAASTQGAASAGTGNTEPEVYLSAEFVKVA